jgi:thiamine-monophosphate kinase
MALGEFDLIKRYFSPGGKGRKDVVLGVGDDAAILAVPENQQLVVTVDTLVESVHFLPDVSPADLAYKALAVNLSDLAAMGAEPAWVTLSLTIPEVNEEWLSQFSAQFMATCQFYDVQLVGGDTCKGPLAVTVQAMGHIPLTSTLNRSGAKVGDLVYVTGTLGDAAGGLALVDDKRSNISVVANELLARLNRPTPRLEAGMLLRQIASAAIDISDGFVQDLNHILERSNVGAVVEINDLPLSEPLSHCYSENQARSFAMTGGDDYELCFTVPENNKAKLEKIFATASTPITQVGRITASKGLQLRNKAKEVALKNSGFDHFQANESHEHSH